MAAGTLLRQLKSSFYTDVPGSYMEKVTTEKSAKIGVHFEGEKELYHVKVFFSSALQLLVLKLFSTLIKLAINSFNFFLHLM